MDYSLKNKCDLFIKNRSLMKDGFQWSNSYFYPLCAMMYTEKGLTVDVHRISECKKMINSETKAFSSFRAMPRLSLATMLSLESNSGEAFRKTIKAYSELRAEFRASDYLPFAAYTLAMLSKADDYTAVIRRARSIYERMGAHHPLMTSYRNVTFAILLAIKNDSDHIVSEVERCYSIIKSEKSGANAYFLACILALVDESPEVKCNRALTLLQELNDAGCKYSMRYELPIIGTAVISNNTSKNAVGSISEVNAYLKEQKGFGVSLGKAQRLMYSVMLVSSEALSVDYAETASLVNSTITLVTAQQAALAAAIAASAAAASSASC